MSAWIPAAGQPIGHVSIGGQRYPVAVDNAYYRALQTVFNERLGGIVGKSITQIDATAQGASSVVSVNAAALHALIDEATVNAAALNAAIASLVAAGAPGAGSIPPVDPTPVFPPVDPGTDIP